MKKIIIITLCILFCFALTGCATQINKSESSKPTASYAMIVMPDGSIIKGKCKDYMRYSNNWIEVQIDEITYRTNDWRVIIYK